MNQKQFFELGCKLLGLYFVASALPALLSVLVSEALSGGTRPGAPGISRWLSVLYPLVFIFWGTIGLYLIKGGSLIRRVALLDADGDSNAELKDVFTVGVKLYGVFLAIGTVPTFLRLLSNYVFVVNLRHGFAAAEVFGIQTYFIPSMVSILFGVLIFFRGEMLTNYAFSTKADGATSDC